MRSLISCCLIALLSFGLFINEASAKRFGGGRSFGVQRSHSSLFSGNKTQQTASLNKNINKSRWGGMLGGLLVGGLLGSLFMGHGLASGMMSWLLLGIVAVMVMNFLRRRTQPAMQTAQANAFNQNTFNSPFNQYYANANSASAQTVDFANETFLRQAKSSFIRLQAAYDQENLEDIKTFTLPEVYAEIQMQLSERGNEANRTEVVQLSAELLDMSNQSYSKVASVRFTGSIKENGELNQLDEIWHFRQLENSQEWLVGGIQQEVYQP